MLIWKINWYRSKGNYLGDSFRSFDEMMRTTTRDCQCEYKEVERESTGLGNLLEGQCGRNIFEGGLSD